MTQLLAILAEPERSAMAFERLSVRFPGVKVTTGGAAVATDHAADAEILVTIGPALGRAANQIFVAAGKLRWIQSIGTGTDNLLGHPALRPGVAVTNVRGVHGDQMSEAAIGAMLALARDLPRIVRQQAEARWERFAPRLLAGATVGILGLGAIAAALAPRLKALGMTTVGIGGTPRALDGFDRVEPRGALVEVAAGLDYLVVLTPYSTDTHHLVDAAVLAAMKPDACVVNLARGGVVDEAALLIALDAGRLSGAALDVFAQEPLGADSPWWRHPRVLVTPHLGGFHAGYGEQVYTAVADNLRRYLAGGIEALVNRVDA
ncbi:D-2-hydroxyacid dehydrogenase [Sphingomonas sp.]|uniref:D-2-hydroxyacid dehydrogenase n=1 Tax=Sphingomonas sp. TaxID=28214 RepID=UPI003CC5CEC7